MAKPILTDLNLNKNELQNAVIQNLATAPASPISGQMYFDTVDDVAYIFDGTAWRNALSTGDYTFQNGIEELTGDDAGKVQIKLATGANAGNVTFTANANGLKGEVADATTSVAGVVEYATDAEFTTGTSEVLVVNPKQVASGTQTLTNKTIDADNNTISNLETDNLKSGVLQTSVRAVASASDTALASEKAIATAIKDFIKLTDLSIASASGNYLGYNNTTGEFSAKVDTTVTEDSTNLVTSGATFNAVKDKIELTDLSIASASANYLGYNNANGQFSAKVDTTVTDNSTNLVTSGAVATAIANAISAAVIYKGTWAAAGQTDYSGITLPVKAGYLYYVSSGNNVTIGGIEWNAGDYLLVNEDVAAGGTLDSSKVQKIDNTEASDIVRLNSTQTLTNKTIDADNNTISNLETDNFKSGVVVASSTGISGVSAASDTKLATEKAIATALATKANKLIAQNSAITPDSGIATWTIPNTLATADVVVMVKEVATGDEVITDVRVSAENIIIKFNASAAVAAGTYKAVIIGC